MNAIMRRVMIVVGTIGLVAAALSMGACGGGPYGVTDKAPLGTLQGIDVALRARVQTVKELDEDRAAFYAGMHQELAFASSLEGTEYNERGEWVVVFHDDKGKVKAVVANVRSGAAGFSRVGRVMESFVSQLWLAFAPDEPTFEARHYNQTDDSQYRFADFGNAKRGGMWVKESGSGHLSDVGTISDKVVLWSL